MGNSKGVAAGPMILLLAIVAGAVLIGSSTGKFTSVVTDLEVTSISANPSTVVSGSSTTVSIMVKNNADTEISKNGVTPSAKLELKDLTTGNVLTTWIIQTLFGSAPRTFTYAYDGVTGEGFHTLQAFIDSEDALIEFNEENNKKTTSLIVNLVPNNPPTTDVNHAPANPTTSDTITFTATASDSDGTVTQLQIYINSALKKTCTAGNGTQASPCTHSQTLSAGTHNYHSRATDNNGAVGQSVTKSVTVESQNQTQNDTTPPSATALHSPSSPTTSDVVTITVTGTDAQSAVTQTQIYVDGTLWKTCSASTCSYSQTYSAGTHTYFGKATSSGGTGQSTTGSFTVTQSDTTPPSATALHSPSSPTTSDVVTITVTGTDAQSAVTQTQIYVDGTLWKTCSASTCSYSQTYSAGTHTYFGKATSSGGTGQSTTGSFTVTQSATPPNVATNSATSVTSSSASLNGAANPNGASTTGWFRYSTSNPGSCSDSFGTRVPSAGGISLGSGTKFVPYSASISGLSSSATYYYCAIAENVLGKGYSPSLIAFTFENLLQDSPQSTATIQVPGDQYHFTDGGKIALDASNNLFVLWDGNISKINCLNEFDPMSCTWTDSLFVSRRNNDGTFSHHIVTDSFHHDSSGGRYSLKVLGISIDSQNRIYVLYAGAHSVTDTDWTTYLTYSDDNGLTWSLSKRIHDPISTTEEYADLVVGANDEVYVVVQEIGENGNFVFLASHDRALTFSQPKILGSGTVLQPSIVLGLDQTIYVRAPGTASNGVNDVLYISTDNGLSFSLLYGPAIAPTAVSTVSQDVYGNSVAAIWKEAESFNNPNNGAYIAISSDKGALFSVKKVSDNQNKNIWHYRGEAVAIKLSNIAAFWSQVDRNNELDEIGYSLSYDMGRTFTKPGVLVKASAVRDAGLPLGYFVEDAIFTSDKIILAYREEYYRYYMFPNEGVGYRVFLKEIPTSDS